MRLREWFGLATSMVLASLVIFGCCGTQFTATGTAKEIATGDNCTATAQERATACTRAKANIVIPTCPQAGDDPAYTKLSTVTAPTCTYATGAVGEQCFVTATATATYICCAP